MTTEHTPGPWTVESYDDNDRLNGWAYLIREVEAEYEAAHRSDDDDLMDAANAHHAANLALISAAPDLLAALEAVLGMNMPPAGQPGHIDWMQAAVMAQRAVARARSIGQNIDTKA